ncbi:MAG: V-type synthase subunit [Bryobacterales bacterium]|nr:V-type synthase subunit [Bryobacterales bacterium]
MSMLAPEPMLEVNLFVLEPDLELVTATLAGMEVLHLDDVTPEGLSASSEWSDLANRYRTLTQRLSETLSALDWKPVQGTKPNQDLHPTRDWRDIEARLTALETKIGPWAKRLEETKQELEKVKQAELQVRLLLPLDVPVEELRRLQHQALTVGTMPAENVPRVAEALFQIPFFLITLQSRKGRALVLAGTSIENAAILDRALKSAFFEPITLPSEAQGRPAEALEALKRKAQEVQDRLHDLERERERLATELSPELNRLWSQAAADGRLAEAMRRFPKYSQVFLISGWVPARELEAVKQAVEKAAAHPIATEVLKPDPNRQRVPILVRSPRWLQPFEELVGTFDLPSYNELDPTPIVAVSFLIMYGMMFGDLGHGLLLVLTGLWLRRRWWNPGIVVTAAGMSGILFGLLYGDAFGRQIMRALWVQPLEGIWNILLISVAGGIVLLNIGFVLNMANAWRARDWPRFLLDRNGLVGIALYWALLGGGLGAAFGTLPKRAMLLIAVLCAVLWLREPLIHLVWRRPAAPVGEALLTGFWELFETLTEYVSNSLSFVRLGAFAIAHQSLSELVVAYSAGPWGWLVLPVGTIVVVGFEGVIVGIQALRLEYYEFFGRFFQGGGQPFMPLSLQMGGRHATVGVRA